jgi:hypothetical protein
VIGRIMRWTRIEGGMGIWGCDHGYHYIGEITVRDGDRVICNGIQCPSGWDQNFRSLTDFGSFFLYENFPACDYVVMILVIRATEVATTTIRNYKNMRLKSGRNISEMHPEESATFQHTVLTRLVSFLHKGHLL